MAWLTSLRESRLALAGLFLFTVTPRALLLALVPLEALDRLGDASSVSVLFFVASIFGVAGSLSIPVLIRRISTFWLFHVAAACAMLACVLLSQPALVLFLAGMVAWVFSAVAFEICMNLYVMHRVPRSQLSRFEPIRILFAVVGYSVGPWLGVYLNQTVSESAPFFATSLTAAVAVALFRLLGLRETGNTQSVGPPSNPIRLVPTFFSQPRLRLAWLITLARTGWWSTFFVYTPIYAVSIGMSENDGGALVSLGVATVYTVTLWAKLGRRYGFRSVCIGGFAITGIVSLAIPLADGGGTETWPLGPILLLVAAFCAASLDSIGHMAYLRAVRPRDRESMSGVYSTYRDAAQLLPPGIFALVLLVAPLTAVFATAGLWMLATAWFCRYLPRRLR